MKGPTKTPTPLSGDLFIFVDICSDTSAFSNEIKLTALWCLYFVVRAVCLIYYYVMLMLMLFGNHI